MADLPTEFWGGYIIVLTVVSFVAALWLVLSLYFAPETMAEAPTETWDDTLKEGFSPAPMWWLWLMIALMAVSVVYLMLYPGLGTFRGVLEWSQGGEFAEKLEEYDARFGAERSRLADESLANLQQDEAAMQSAWSIFNIHCTACHGPEAQGQANLFPDLTDASWQWGNNETQIQQTITMGRQGVMPALQAALDDQGVARMSDYVLALAAGNAGDPALSEAATQYATYCSACHGADGSGNPLLGAPALNDDAWLYGGDRAAIVASIAQGRSGMMPSFADRLDTTQVRLLTAWLSAGAEPRRGP